MIDAEQRESNIRAKVRMISDRIRRHEGWGVCTGDLERFFLLREIDRLAGIQPKPLPREACRALTGEFQTGFTFEERIRDLALTRNHSEP